MDQLLKTFIINDRWEAAPVGDAHPGEWVVTDLESGRVESRCVRTVGELAEIVGAESIHYVCHPDNVPASVQDVQGIAVQVRDASNGDPELLDVRVTVRGRPVVCWENVDLYRPPADMAPWIRDAAAGEVDRISNEAIDDIVAGRVEVEPLGEEESK